MINFFKINKGKLFIRKQEGITSIEYGLIAVALSVVVVVILYDNPDGFIWAVSAKFERLASLVSSAILN